QPLLHPTRFRSKPLSRPYRCLEVLSFQPPFVLCAANNSCSRRLNATGSADNPSREICFMTSVGMPLGLSSFNGGMGLGNWRLLSDAAVFCFDEGFPAQDIGHFAERKAPDKRFTPPLSASPIVGPSLPSWLAATSSESILRLRLARLRSWSAR